VVVVGPKEGWALGGGEGGREGGEEGGREEEPRIWSSFSRGYRREGDAVWVAGEVKKVLREGGREGEREGGLEVHPCPSAQVIMAKAFKAVSGPCGREGGREGGKEGTDHQQPDLLWLDLPFRDYYSPLEPPPSILPPSPKHFTSLAQIDCFLGQLMEGAREGTLLLLALQGDLYPVYDLMEAKQRCRWDTPSSSSSSSSSGPQQIAGTVRTPWVEEDERSLVAHAADALNGVVLVGVKRQR